MTLYRYCDACGERIEGGFPGGIRLTLADGDGEREQPYDSHVNCFERLVSEAPATLAAVLRRVAFAQVDAIERERVFRGLPPGQYDPEAEP